MDDVIDIICKGIVIGSVIGSASGPLPAVRS
jgi:hypothetical protein